MKNYDKIVGIRVTPAPEILLRIIMIFQGFDKYEEG